MALPRNFQFVPDVAQPAKTLGAHSPDKQVDVEDDCQVIDKAAIKRNAVSESFGKRPGISLLSHDHFKEQRGEHQTKYHIIFSEIRPYFRTYYR